MRSLILSILFSIFTYTNALATTYYASPSGGGAASCIDNGANVCTLQRAVTVSAAGTNTIVCAAGTYSITTALVFNATNTNGNITIQPASGATVTLGSTGATTVIDIQAVMVSGSITFSGINFSDADTDTLVTNTAPEVNLTINNSTMSATDATVGRPISLVEDTTNRIAQTAGADTVTGLRTGATTNVKIAQQITVGGSNITVNRAALYLYKNGTLNFPEGKVVSVTLETNNAGAPSGTPVTNGTSNSIEVYNINTQGQWVFFDFSPNVTLNAGTIYWVVLQGDTTASASNYISWAADSTSGAYAGGDSSTYDGTSWTASAAGVDYLFAVNRNHTRDLTVTNSTITGLLGNIVADWFNNLTYTSNSGTETANTNGSMITASQTESGPIANSIVVTNSSFTSTSSGTKLINTGTGIAVNPVRKVVIKNNTGTLVNFLNMDTYVEKLLVEDNNFTLTCTGTNCFNLGKEVDGVDPQTFNYYPFSQIVIEGNTFYYSGTTHNHLALFAIGSDNGVFRNNTVTVGGNGTGSNSWGFVLKSNGWFFEGNKIFGVCPAIAVYGTNNSRIVYNTLDCQGNGSDGAILIRNHQDQIYGPKTFGISFYNYIKDNIVISESAMAAIDYGGTTAYGFERTPQFWSNIVDNNTYFARTNTNYADYETTGSQEYVTLAEGVALLRTTWQSSTYTDSKSLSNYNDLNSVFADVGIARDSAQAGIFNVNSSYVIGQGKIDGTNIGADQVSGSQSGGPFGSAQFGSGF